MMKMAMKVNLDKEELRKEIDEFEAGFKSVVLGTVSKAGEVDVTYAPYVKYEGEGYIFISEIGDHYDNLVENTQKFEIMFLQDEKEAASVLVRKRLRYNVIAEFQPRNERFETILDIFEERMGHAVKIVRKMQDFHLVKLNVIDGRFVKGFGQAFNLKGDDIIHITGDKKIHR
ncbi:pyridoxamine 5'-phosphate oxidase family protein [Cetobacterium sp.]|uniref:pyridoxamine 5'-phosphate oxidase family protein n=1 Tax=Cetobacterium sp. TaxID=2071632 RepID=UPI003F36E199